MAVIREQRTFRNQPIGVVRASRAGEEYWQTVGRAADELTQTAYRAAADQAKRTGMETAAAIKGSDFRTIDPLTGEIETFNMPSVPEGFGTIARDAFEQVAENRYVKSVETAIKEKSAEIAISHQNHPQAVERYEADMGEYLSQVTKNVQPRFQETTRDIAAAWMASTRTNLLAKRFAIQQEIERSNLENDAKTQATTISNLSSMDSPDAGVLFESEIQKQRNAVNAGVQTGNQADANIAIMRRGMKTGLLSKSLSLTSTYEDTDANGNKVQKPVTTSIALLVENSIDNQAVNENLPESLKPLVKSIIEDSTFVEDREFIGRFVSSQRVALSQQEGSVKKATKLEIATKKIINGQRVFNTDAVSREAAQNIIRDDAGLPKDVSMNEYFGLPQSVGNSTLNTMLYRGLVPDALMQNIGLVTSGDQPASDEFIETTFNHYLNYSSMIDSSGQRRNLLLIDGGITKEQDAMMRSAIAMRNFRGGNLRDILSRQRTMLEDEGAFNIRASDVFKDFASDRGADSANARIDRFISTKLNIGNDIYAIRNIRPLINHMIATGHNLESIKTETEGLLSELYMEDDEDLVADPFNFDPNKSFYALKRVFPDDKDRDNFKLEVQLELDKRFDGFMFVDIKDGSIQKQRPFEQTKAEAAEFLAPKEKGKTIVSKKVRLVPLPQQPLSTESTVIYMGVYRDDNGDMVPLQDASGPFMISSDVISEQQAARIESQRQALIAEQDAIIKRREEQKERVAKEQEGFLKLFGKN